MTDQCQFCVFGPKMLERRYETNTFSFRDHCCVYVADNLLHLEG